LLYGLSAKSTRCDHHAFGDYVKEIVVEEQLVMAALAQVLLREGKKPGTPAKVEHGCGPKPSQKANDSVPEDFLRGDHDDLWLQKAHMP
jgi:hypothetical protein